MNHYGRGVSSQVKEGAWASHPSHVPSDQLEARVARTGHLANTLDKKYLRPRLGSLILNETLTP